MTLPVQASAPFRTATTRGRPFRLSRRKTSKVGPSRWQARTALLTRCSAWHSQMRALVPDPGRIDKSFFRETLAGGSIHSRRGLLFRHIIPAPRGQASGLLRFGRTSGILPPTRRIAPAGQPLLSGPAVRPDLFIVIGNCKQLHRRPNRHPRAIARRKPGTTSRRYRGSELHEPTPPVPK